MTKKAITQISKLREGVSLGGCRMIQTPVATSTNARAHMGVPPPAKTTTPNASRISQISGRSNQMAR